MKTLSVLVRRYVTAAIAIVLLVLFVNLALFLGLVIHYGRDIQENGGYRLSQLAASFTADSEGKPVPAGRSADELFSGYAWAMLLSDSGSILWSHRLPDELNHPYTVSQAAVFSRWYLADYPVFVYRNDFGLLVLGREKNSMARFNFYIESQMLQTMLDGFYPMLALDAALILAACVFLSLRAARSLRSVEEGVSLLSQGKPVCLAERGMTAALAAQLNRTSAHLARQQEIIAKRDSARTSWIAGVSHDIRTPLSLILCSAEQLEEDDALMPAQRERAAVIRAQSQKIGALIEDLNLTSKLQYNAQPLRKVPVSAGALLRGVITDFINSPASRHCRVGFDMTDAAGQAMLFSDAALLRRALDNLLLNCARHNPQGCAVSVQACLRKQNNTLYICVRDDGKGYPERVLSVLGGAPEADVHILGLHLVRQIIEAHSGKVCFSNDGGAKAEICLPADA